MVGNVVNLNGKYQGGELVKWSKISSLLMPCKIVHGHAVFSSQYLSLHSQILDQSRSFAYTNQVTQARHDMLTKN